MISDSLKQVLAEAGRVIPEVLSPLPHNEAMESRVKKLEDGQQELKTQFVRMDGRFDRIDERFERADQRMGHIEATMATKADLAETTTSIIKWIVGTALIMSGTAVTVMTFVLNNATPKAPAASPQPIVIYAPAPAAQPVPVAPTKP